MNPAAPASQGRPAGLDWRQCLAYGLLGLPLAFVALPLYVLLPHHYAHEFGLSLATLGALLLGARLLDAVLDPWFGQWLDRRFARSARSVQRAGLLAACVLAAGLTAVFLPPVRSAGALLAWAALALCLTYAAYSVLAIAHQTWGARLGGGEVERGRIVVWREGAGLAGVVLASVLPGWLGLEAMLLVFALSLALGWLAWWQGPQPAIAASASAAAVRAPLWQPWRQPAFSALLAGLLAELDEQQQAARYFGWWNFATKLNLALAAGLALPLLGWWGYQPGSRDPQGLQALGWAYAVLPCILKLFAATALWRWSRWHQSSLRRSSP